MKKEYIYYKCPDNTSVIDWGNALWKFGYPTYPKHCCIALERGLSEGGMVLPKLFAQLNKKYEMDT